MNIQDKLRPVSAPVHRKYPTSFATMIGSLALVLCQVTGYLHAQTTATLSGTVVDSTGAVIPGAKVTLTKPAGGDARQTRSNGTGFFNFIAVNAGTYTLSVEAPSFDTWKLSAFDIHPADNKSLGDIRMVTGRTETTVEVNSGGGGIIQDSGQIGSVITADDLQRLSTEGRSATELIKMLPGFAINTGVGGLANSSFDPTLSTISNTALGSYSANGMPAGAIQETLNGANVIDPGSMANGEATMNMDMVQEVNVQTSDFGADSERGPININAVTKSGGAHFHGEAYLYARDYPLNSTDRQLKYQGNLQKPKDHYLYPGGNIGGPIKIPGTRFNRDGSKLTFFSGFEYYDQTFPGPLLATVVPTDSMRAGDFSSASLSTLCAPLGVNYQTANGNASGGPVYCAVPTQTQSGAPIVNGQLTQAMMDPGGLAIYKLFPHANTTPTVNNTGVNYVDQIVQTQNGWQYHQRADLNWNDANKFFVAYNLQHEGAQIPVNQYYTPTNSVPYPGGIVAKISAQSLSANYTHIFGPSLTNELIGTFTYFNQPYQANNLAAVSKSTLGYPYDGLFHNGNTLMPAITQYINAGYPQILMPGGWDKGVFLRKPDYSAQNNLSKTWGRHTAKFGFFYEQQENNQRSTSNVQGMLTFYPYGYQTGVGCNSTAPSPVCFNPPAQILMGAASGYQQNNIALAERNQYKIIAFYAQDSWNITPRLSVNAGVRADHIGPWTDTHGVGAAILLPDTYAAQVGTTQHPGLSWHGIDPSIPLSGIYDVPFAYWSPRFGGAYDVYGKGKTVLRGGWGAYRFQDSVAGVTPALNTAYSATSVSLSQNLNLSAIPNLQPPNQLVLNTTVGSLNPHDSHRAVTYDYNLTIDQQLPGNSVLQISYIGNISGELLAPGISNAATENINTVKAGNLFKLYCNNDYPQLSQAGCAPVVDSKGNPANYSKLTTTQINRARPFPFYSTVNYATHEASANYNGLQASWNRQKGTLIWGLNYTWSKVLGNTGYQADATNFHNNYGPLPGDRSQILNLTYSWSEGQLYHGNRALKAVLNGWEISGISGFQSGPNIQAIDNSNLGFGGTVPQYLPNAGKQLVNTELLGSPDINLQPQLTCNPGAGLHSTRTNFHQFINTNCFAVPDTTSAIFTNGPIRWPYVHAPAYMSNDLSAYKNFKVREGQTLQFRFAAFNFLNHSLTSFNPNNTTNLNLGLNSGSSGTNFVNALNYGSLFGGTNYSIGRRIVELGLKYSF